MKYLIVDDEEFATQVIESHLSHIPDFEVVGIYHSAVEAFLALDKIAVDVLFLDIQMPKITGLEMIKMLKQKPLIVLTTAHRTFALEGFELEVVDYLVKPIGLNRFLKTISRLNKPLHLPDAKQNLPTELEQPIAPSAKHIFIKTNRAYQKVEFDTILHIEAIKNHIKIVTKTEKHISLIALSEFEQQLPKSFLRVHRSFIVNTTNIIKFDNYAIENDQAQIPIGRTCKERVLEYLKQLL